MRNIGFKKGQHTHFARKIGISDSYLTNVLKLQSGPSYGLILGISKNYPQINLNWLLSGQGDFEISEPKCNTLREHVDEYGVRKNKGLINATSLLENIFRSENIELINAITSNLEHFSRNVKLQSEIENLKLRMMELEKMIIKKDCRDRLTGKG